MIVVRCMVMAISVLLGTMTGMRSAALVLVGLVLLVVFRTEDSLEFLLLCFTESSVLLHFLELLLVMLDELFV